MTSLLGLTSEGIPLPNNFFKVNSLSKSLLSNVSANQKPCYNEKVSPVSNTPLTHQKGELTNKKVMKLEKLAPFQSEIILVKWSPDIPAASNTKLRPSRPER